MVAVSDHDPDSFADASAERQHDIRAVQARCQGGKGRREEGVEDRAADCAPGAACSQIRC